MRFLDVDHPFDQVIEPLGVGSSGVELDPHATAQVDGAFVQLREAFVEVGQDRRQSGRRGLVEGELVDQPGQRRIARIRCLILARLAAVVAGATCETTTAGVMLGAARTPSVSAFQTSSCANMTLLPSRRYRLRSIRSSSSSDRLSSQ
jgi:hypothetical protein